MCVRVPVALLVLLVMGAAPGFAQSSNLGIFSEQSDIGAVAKTGSADFDSAKGEYRITGGGENMWFTNDAFHFVWKKISGDIALRCAIEWLGAGGNAHRKACLMVRQTLDEDSAYVDVAVHGDGLTSLQFRERAGGLTHEIQASQSRPPLVGLERQGE